MTGTPLDLTVIPEFLRWLGVAIPLVWLGLLVGALVWAWRGTQTKLGRSVAVAVVLMTLVVLPGWGLNSLRQQVLAQQAEAESQQAAFLKRRAIAEALFKQRCETAGEFIYKTVPDVKGVVWMKWRPKDVNLSDQFRMDDPFGRDCGGEECIKDLLRSTFVVPNHDLNRPRLPKDGYEYVETRDPEDGRLYRYTAGVKAVSTRTPEERIKATKNNDGVDPGAEVFGFALQRVAIEQTTARYGITWEDISTREDREHWVAGGSLSIVDLRTNEVVAKRVGYMMDRGLGNESGFRSPWGLDTHDNSCPQKLDEVGKRTMVGFTRRFTFAVLQPTKGAKQ